MKQKLKSGSGVMIFGVMLMLLLATMCIVQVEAFKMNQDYQDAQTAADTIADAVAVQAYNDGIRYDEAVDYVDELVTLLEENTGIVCTSVELDEDEFESGVAAVTVGVGGTYATDDGVQNYEAHATASTAFEVQPGEGVEAMIEFAIQLAEDDNYYYVYGGYGPYGYDCSGFVGFVCASTGLLEGASTTSRPFYTGSEVSYLLSHGWVEVTNNSGVDVSSGAGLVAGDILWKSSHTEIYIGNYQQVGAHSDNYPTADQISVVSMYSDFTRAFRYVGD